jgi:DNA-binding transcriptional regulator YhcF (GntR family)
LNLSEAARESGQSKSAVWRAVNSGRLPATRTFAGDYRINPAELHRVFSEETNTGPTTTLSMRRDPTDLERAEAASMKEQIERLFEVGKLIRKALDAAAPQG